MSATWQHMAALASSLSAAELRVLLDLTARAEASQILAVKASSRDLARTTGLVRASVQAALDSLHRRQIIESSGGSVTQPSIHRLLSFDEEHQRSGLTVRPEVAQPLGQGGPETRPEAAQKTMHGGLLVRPEVAQRVGQGGPIFEPGVAQILSQGGLTIRPEVAQTPDQGGPVFEPPPNQSSTTCELRLSECASAHTESIDSQFDLERIIDRLQKAQKGDFEESLFEQARQQIASHHARYAREENRLPSLPDNAITAQFLAVAEWPKLVGLLADLAGERKEAGHSYGWYVTVALQRLHGISPEQLRQIRARRKNASTQEAKSTEGQRPIPMSVRNGADALSVRQPRAKGRLQQVQVEQLKQQIRAWAEVRLL